MNDLLLARKSARGVRSLLVVVARIARLAICVSMVVLTYCFRHTEKDIKMKFDDLVEALMKVCPSGRVDWNPITNEIIFETGFTDDEEGNLTDVRGE